MDLDDIDRNDTNRLIRKQWSYILFIKDGSKIEEFDVHRPTLKQIQRVFAKFDSSASKPYTFDQMKRARYSASLKR